MATDTIGELLTRAIAPLAASAADPLAVQLDRLTTQLESLQPVSQAAVEATSLNTSVIQQLPAASSAASSGGSSIASSLLSTFGAGLGLGPLITGIASLFGGGDSETDAPSFLRFQLPTSVNVNAGIQNGASAAFGVDQGQGGVARPVVNSAAPQITVQVQALDSQSILDRSNDIALAVRQAMLESSVLTDVIREV